MVRVRRLEHVGIGTTHDKYDHTVRFYQQVFGWHLIKEKAGELAFIGDGDGGRLEIIAVDAPPLAAPHHLALVVAHDEFDTVMEDIEEAGGRLGESTTNPFGDRLQYFADPAGNWAQIVARREALAP